VLLVAVGIVGRAAERAVRLARREGLRAGLLRPVTLWPFPEDALRKAAAGARAVLVAEMNAGQLVREVERLCTIPVGSLARLDGEPIAPQEIVARLRTMVADG
jgi:2-oxoglutarate ferredoxin oxidoreductase subunit alpha